MEDNTIVAEKETQKPAPKKAFSIERPNYDFIEELESKERKIRIIKKDTNPKKSNRFRVRVAAVALSLIIVMSGTWCAINIGGLIGAYSKVAEVSAEYSISLLKYVNKISALDSANRNLELVETYPEELVDKAERLAKSNWFDKICNMISEWFGG